MATITEHRAWIPLADIREDVVCPAVVSHWNHDAAQWTSALGDPFCLARRVAILA
eukprot:CAMPEP_0185169346 /NCGR_PEP_ID=MMETSP1139-20130426/17148_1 /TAXON_ID=298111 /ORGANISM="Pavlova sp., Strain CCMP459" /LENGTH=54 /DNA_ID=CAMNT_0027734881 /DNA_START=306 /DNA_END=467 /DNA_ORIENTATION=+